jgi:hypothetical protein
VGGMENTGLDGEPPVYAARFAVEDKTVHTSRAPRPCTAPAVDRTAPGGLAEQADAHFSPHANLDPGAIDGRLVRFDHGPGRWAKDAGPAGGGQPLFDTVG